MIIFRIHISFCGYYIYGNYYDFNNIKSIYSHTKKKMYHKNIYIYNSFFFKYNSFVYYCNKITNHYVYLSCLLIFHIIFMAILLIQTDYCVCINLQLLNSSFGHSVAVFSHAMAKWNGNRAGNIDNSN